MQRKARDGENQRKRLTVVKSDATGRMEEEILRRERIETEEIERLHSVGAEGCETLQISKS